MSDDGAGSAAAGAQAAVRKEITNGKHSANSPPDSGPFFDEYKDWYYLVQFDACIALKTSIGHNSVHLFSLRNSTRQNHRENCHLPVD